QSLALLCSREACRKSCRTVLNDGCVSAHHVEISRCSCISRGASRCRSFVPNVLSRRDLAWPGAVLYGSAQGHTDRKRPRDRWNSRVGPLCCRSRFACYFGASEATIFSKRGSPRRESQ